MLTEVLCIQNHRAVLWIFCLCTEVLRGRRIWFQRLFIILDFLDICFLTWGGFWEWRTALWRGSHSPFPRWLAFPWSYGLIVCECEMFAYVLVCRRGQRLLVWGEAVMIILTFWFLKQQQHRNIGMCFHFNSGCEISSCLRLSTGADYDCLML